MEGKGNSKDLLQLEGKNSPSTIESKLVVCKNDDLLQPQTTKSQPPNGEPMTSAPKSQVLGKVKDFLGVISEANQRLQIDAKDSSKDYDIEVLTGNEAEYIEMDLMLGVADLHTPEAVAAAESAIAGDQPVISLAGSSSGTESEDSSDDSDDDDNDSDDNNDDSNDDDDDDDNDTCSPTKSKRSKPARNHQSKKRPKIIELS